MPTNRVPFREWMDNLGDKAAAQLLGVSIKSASSYKLGYRMPSKRVMDRIVERSAYRVTYESIIKNFRGDPWRSEEKA